MTHPEPATAGAESRDTDVGSVFVSNYPPFSAWSSEAAAEARGVLHRPPAAETPFGIYLHIPFCRKRCKFCYFRVYTDKNFDEIGSYLDALGREIERYADMPALSGRRPDFVYFGGGTPSYISVDHLRALVARLEAAFPGSSAAREITFECEPGTLTRSKLEAIREVGVTRLSLGIENFGDDVLRANGRAHVSTEIDRCLPWIAKLDFDQVNIDLIAGMLGETWENWRDTVSRTVELAPDSVTVYQMELPYNTRFSQSLQDGTLEVPLADWDLKRAWHAHAIERLEEAGYEISSAYTMVRSDKKSEFLYRNSVWRGCDLLGTGVASFSHVGGVHFQNVDGWGEYLARAANGDETIARAFATTPDDRLIREFILQMKLGRLPLEPFRRKFDVDVAQRFEGALTSLAEQGMLEVGNDEIRLTRDGLLRVDMLLPAFYDSRYRGARYT